MNDRQAFKFAFLMECARDGLTEAETREKIARLEKRAWPDILGAAQSVGGLSAATLVGGSALTGGALGALAAKLREGTFDVDSAKKHELIAAYNSFADEAHHVGRSRRRPESTVRIPLN